MLVLAETAAYHEVPLLRDALWQHLAGRTSLKVRIPVSINFFFVLAFLFPDWTLTLSVV